MELDIILANLRGEIARRGLSESRAAVLCGMSQTALSRRLNRAAPLTVEELLVICVRLQITFSDLTRPVPPQQRDVTPSATVVTGDKRSVIASGNVIPFPRRPIDAVETGGLAAPVIQLRGRAA